MTCPDHGPSCDYWGDKTPRRIDLTVWNRWVPVRFERTADGARTFYFGFGKVVVRRG